MKASWPRPRCVLPNVEPKSDSSDVHNWTVERVAEWAATLPLPKGVSERLQENAVNGPVLETLTDEDLETIGVGRFGWRRQLLISRRELLSREEPVSVSHMASDEASRSGFLSNTSLYIPLCTSDCASRASSMIFEDSFAHERPHHTSARSTSGTVRPTDIISPSSSQPARGPLHAAMGSSCSGTVTPHSPAHLSPSSRKVCGTKLASGQASGEGVVTGPGTVVRFVSIGSISAGTGHRAALTRQPSARATSPPGTHGMRVGMHSVRCSRPVSPLGVHPPAQNSSESSSPVIVGLGASCGSFASFDDFQSALTTAGSRPSTSPAAPPPMSHTATALAHCRSVSPELQRSPRFQGPISRVAHPVPARFQPLSPRHAGQAAAMTRGAFPRLCHSSEHLVLHASK